MWRTNCDFGRSARAAHASYSPRIINAATASQSEVWTQGRNHLDGLLWADRIYCSFTFDTTMPPHRLRNKCSSQSYRSSLWLPYLLRFLFLSSIADIYARRASVTLAPRLFMASLPSPTLCFSKCAFPEASAPDSANCVWMPSTRCVLLMFFTNVIW